MLVKPIRKLEAWFRESSVKGFIRMLFIVGQIRLPLSTGPFRLTMKILDHLFGLPRGSTLRKN
jgi:hypothetical protein